MQARRKGAIINMGSVFGDRPMPLMSTYSASKAFTRYWTKSLEVELRPYHIDVLLLEPSFAVGPGNFLEVFIISICNFPYAFIFYPALLYARKNFCVSSCLMNLVDS